MFPIKWNDAFRKKDGTLVNMEDMGGGGSSDIPEYSEADAGKVLRVDDSGELEWTTVNGMKLYYKDITYNKNAGYIWSQITGDYYLGQFRPDNVPGINVNGYTPIFAGVEMLYDSSVAIANVNKFHGYGGGYGLTILANKNAVDSALSNPIRVYYVKNSDSSELV